MNFAKCISLFGISLACMFNPLSAQEPSVTDAKSAQLAELEKEKSYQMIREYIDYANEFKDVRIPVEQGFKNYFKIEPEPETYAPVFKGKADVFPKKDLDEAWEYVNLLGYQLEKKYLEIPEAAEMEKEYRAKNIGRKEYQEKKKEIQSDLMYSDLDAREKASAYQQALTDACRASLVIIMADHMRQDIAIPTDWISESLQKRFAKSKRVKDVQKKIDALNN